MKFLNPLFCYVLYLLLTGLSAAAQPIFTDPNLYHLRIGDKMQWAEFPGTPHGKELTVTFDAKAQTGKASLFIRQFSVLLDWTVTLNDHKLGRLAEDEKDMISAFDIPDGVLISGKNTLRISPAANLPATSSNDIRVGQFVVEAKSVSDVLSQATLDLEVKETGIGSLIPSRITVVDKNGVLQPLSNQSGEMVAIRPGFVYTGNGKAKIGLQPGTYRIFATRGFEYGVDSATVTLKAGDHLKQNFSIRREVSTPGWVSSDTHIHTFTHSGHGDANDEERMLSIAGEGIELPIITDHNVYADLNPAAKKLGLNPYLTLVNGIEVTTPIGHFNMFPIDLKNPVINHKVASWDELSNNVAKTGTVKGIILNHARDLHSNYRPFDPSRHIASAGMTLTGWKLPNNAMEVINSGATQTDIMRLFNDWFGLLNRGYSITPAGSTDTHTISRYLLGQARTYIRTKDDIPGNINVADAIEQFRKGKVTVSYGLMTELVVNKVHQSGDTVLGAGKELTVSVRVLGPGWATADKVVLYSNGKKIKEMRIQNGRKAGVKWEQTWKMTLPKHDVFLVAIAEGPGEPGPFWQIAKPYQPTSPEWPKRVMGSSGALFIDADHDKNWSNANAYARILLGDPKDIRQNLAKKLAGYDEAVAVQAAAILQEKGISVTEIMNEKNFESASAETKAGFQTFVREAAFSQTKQ
ncbi:CehA/McbA family metallohydrolase [Dyadobacter sp. CY323]|uniref:CehA/McbA family metallohydrolase n=1 Tax=Dyadobacter sp. CY323 TaxID=2907302 RepID=UPI001F1842E7|nr:CehA/McbA family metallohydrolase [Dyadobacter sp. CY323]MCE6992628.1 CehA/McbA family metallohydrolase [Dyadobacter sp. CY323]